MRSIVEPSLNTSHIGLTGRLMDQPAMNILLHAGSPKVFNTGEVFNNVKGYIGNQERKHKFSDSCSKKKIQIVEFANIDP